MATAEEDEETALGSKEESGHCDMDGEEEMRNFEPPSMQLSAVKECYNLAEEDVFSFSMWIEIGGEKAKVYKPVDMSDCLSEGWIASEAGMVRLRSHIVFRH